MQNKPSPGTRVRIPTATNVVHVLRGKSGTVIESELREDMPDDFALVLVDGVRSGKPDKGFAIHPESLEPVVEITLDEVKLLRNPRPSAIAAINLLDALEERLTPTRTDTYVVTVTKSTTYTPTPAVDIQRKVQDMFGSVADVTVSNEETKR